MPDTDHPLSCGDIVGLLAQPDRRAAFAALALGATTLAEVAAATGLRAPTAAAALAKLVDGRVATTADGPTYALVDDAFRTAVATEARLAGRSRGDGAGAYLRRGRLVAIPADPAVRARLLALVADSFSPDTPYTEPQVNALCAEWHDDWTTLRRALVDASLLHRTPEGTTYTRLRP
jgi:hypothetical protein